MRLKDLLEIFRYLEDYGFEEHLVTVDGDALCIPGPRLTVDEYSFDENGIYIGNDPISLYLTELGCMYDVRRGWMVYA